MNLSRFTVKSQEAVVEAQSLALLEAGFGSGDTVLVSSDTDGNVIFSKGRKAGREDARAA